MKKLLAVLLAMVMAFSIMVPAFAAESASIQESTDTTAAEAFDQTVSPRTVSIWQIGQNNRYVQVIGTEVRNKTVYVNVLNSVSGDIPYNASDYQVDIRVSGPQGLIWSEEDWMKGNNHAAFWIGTDVNSVMIRIVPRSKLFPAPARAFNVQISY